MRQFKIFNELEKEENYLQAMGKEGYILKKYSTFGFYHFFKGEKESLNYRIDYRTFDNKKDFEDYKIMFDDFGWKHVSGTAYSGKQHFLSKNNDADDKLFSSKESLANCYKRIFQMFLMSILCLITYCFIVLECYLYNGSNFKIFDISLWAWIPIILFVILALVYGVRFINAKKKYNLKIKE